MNLCDLIQERLQWLKAEVSQEDFTIEFECPAPVFVYADPFRIGQVVTILIKNAIRYAHSGKKLTITVNHADDKVIVGFRDYGPGVSEAFLPLMFERFSREERSRSKFGREWTRPLYRHGDKPRARRQSQCSESS